MNEPLYVEIDPTMEEECHDDQQGGVSWETNIEYEPLSSPPQQQTTNESSPLSRSASAPGHEPLLKHASEEDSSSSPCATGGVKLKVATSGGDKTKPTRSKSISPRSKNISSEIGDQGWDDGWLVVDRHSIFIRRFRSCGFFIAEPRTPPPVPLGVKLKRRWSKEKSESIYRTIRRYRKNYINLDRKNIQLEEKIGERLAYCSCFF